MRLFRSAPFYYWLVFFVFLMVYAGFGVVYFEKQAEYRRLETQMTPNKLLLQRPRPDFVAMDAQLARAEAELKAKWNYLPGQDKCIEQIQTLISLADNTTCNVTGVSAAAPVKKTSQGATYYILSYSVTVEGTDDAILTFTQTLAQNPGILQGMEVDSINIGTSRNEALPYTATVKILIPTKPDFGAKAATGS